MNLSVRKRVHVAHNMMEVVWQLGRNDLVKDRMARVGTSVF